MAFASRPSRCDGTEGLADSDGVAAGTTKEGMH